LLVSLLVSRLLRLLSVRRLISQNCDSAQGPWPRTAPVHPSRILSTSRPSQIDLGTPYCQPCSSSRWRSRHSEYQLFLLEAPSFTPFHVLDVRLLLWVVETFGRLSPFVAPQFPGLSLRRPGANDAVRIEPASAEALFNSLAVGSWIWVCEVHALARSPRNIRSIYGRFMADRKGLSSL
jgi:hypothetical protein